MLVEDAIPETPEVVPIGAFVIWGAVEQRTFHPAGKPPERWGSVHTVHLVPGSRPELGPGASATYEAWAKLSKGIGGTGNTGRRLLPEYMLYTAPDRMLWWRPAQRRPVFFNTGRKAFDQAMRRKQALFPDLLFLALPGHLFVWALAEGVRPTGRTRLWQAPFLNIYASGHMCAGTSKLPLEMGDVSPFEKAFFETTFTHTSRGDALTSHPDGHDGLWRALSKWKPNAADPVHSFPAQWLREMPRGEPSSVSAALDLETGRR